MSAILAVLVSLLLRGSVLVALGALTCLLARRRPAALRHAVWCAVLVAIAALPVVQPIVPAWRIPLAAPVAATTQTATAQAAIVSQSAASHAPAPPLPGPATWLVLGWAVIALLLLARLTRAHLRLERIARRALRVEDGILLSEEIAVPIVAGRRHPRVLLPASSRDWTPACRRNVVSHELAHVRRGDLAWLTFSRLLSSVLWFHPLVHFACARLRVEAERASDDAVLRSGEAPSGYAQVLLDLSTRLVPLRYEAGIPLLRREHLSERIESIVAGDRSHGSLGLLPKVAWAPALLLAVVLVSSPAAETAGPHRIQGRARVDAKVAVRVLGVRAWFTPLNRGGRIDSPELDLENTSQNTIRSVLVRLVTPGLSSDQLWCSVMLKPGAHATLHITPDEWANEGPVSTLRAFEATITDAREEGPPNNYKSFVAPKAVEQLMRTARPDSERAPEHYKSLAAPQAMRQPAPEAPTDGDRAPAQVYRTGADAPVFVENAWTPLSTPPASENEIDRGHDLTWMPGYDLHNVSTKTVKSVRIRYKAETESHAVTSIEGPIAPGQTLRVAPGKAMWGRPEAMTIQVLGVWFTDGSKWGSLDSTIDTRRGFIR